MSEPPVFPDTPGTSPEALRRLLRMTVYGAMASSVLAAIKISAGVIGRSTALIADGVESLLDLVGAVVVYNGMRIAAQPPDQRHPYGHGKAEPLASAFVALLLLLAAVWIAWESIAEILGEATQPKAWTLLVLVLVVGTKETMFRLMRRIGRESGSGAMEADAWHHRSDAITSIAAFIGISIALIGGPAWASADSWAALLACLVIAFNGIRLLRPALDEAMDATVEPERMDAVRRKTLEVDGVVGVHRCRMRKSGYGVWVDIEVLVGRELTVSRGHDISTQVRDALLKANMGIADVWVHIEPDDPGRLRESEQTPQG